MTSIDYSITCCRKYVNHISIEIDDNLEWAYIESNVTHPDLNIVKNQIAKAKAMLNAAGVKSFELTSIKAIPELRRVAVEEFSSLPQQQTQYISPAFSGNETPEIVLSNTPVSIHSAESKEKPTVSPIREETKVKRKSKPTKPLPASLTSDTKKILEIMKKSGRDKCPKFAEESNRRTCMNYIKNNLNNKNITVIEHIYKEVVEFLESEPDFAKPEE